MKAQAFLEELDNHPVIGPLIDCTSNFEAEQAEMMRKSVRVRASGHPLDDDAWSLRGTAN